MVLSRRCPEYREFELTLNYDLRGFLFGKGNDFFLLQWPLIFCLLHTSSSCKRWGAQHTESLLGIGYTRSFAGLELNISHLWTTLSLTPATGISLLNYKLE